MYSAKVPRTIFLSDISRCVLQGKWFQTELGFCRIWKRKIRSNNHKIKRNRRRGKIWHIFFHEVQLWFIVNVYIAAGHIDFCMMEDSKLYECRRHRTSLKFLDIHEQHLAELENRIVYYKATASPFCIRLLRWYAERHVSQNHMVNRLAFLFPSYEPTLIQSFLMDIAICHRRHIALIWVLA